MVHGVVRKTVRECIRNRTGWLEAALADELSLPFSRAALTLNPTPYEDDDVSSDAQRCAQLKHAAASATRQINRLRA